MSLDMNLKVWWAICTLIYIVICTILYLFFRKSTNPISQQKTPDINSDPTIKEKNMSSIVGKSLFVMRQSKTDKDNSRHNSKSAIKEGSFAHTERLDDSKKDGVIPLDELDETFKDNEPMDIDYPLKYVEEAKESDDLNRIKEREQDEIFDKELEEEEILDLGVSNREFAEGVTYEELTEAAKCLKDEALKADSKVKSSKASKESANSDKEDINNSKSEENLQKVSDRQLKAISKLEGTSLLEKIAEQNSISSDTISTLMDLHLSKL